MAEKEKKKSAKGGALLIIILLLIIAALVALLLLDPFGWGIFGGGGSSTGGTGSGSATQSTTVAAAAESTEPQKQTVFIEVRISGATYIYNDSEASAEDIINAAKNAEGDEIIVRIKDDSATENAVSDLTAALDKENISWLVEE